MTSYLRPLILVCAMVMGQSAVAPGQAGTAHVNGVVVDLSSGAAVTNADIVHLGGTRRTVSDSLGKFILSDLPAGIVRILVRVPGFPPTLVAVALARGETMSRVIALDSTLVGRTAAQKLPAEAVVAMTPPAPRYADFERRRLTGRGQYLSSEDLERGRFGSLQDAMRGLRGVNVECGGGNGCAIRMSRAPMRCMPEYIVDERVDNLFGQNTPIRDIEGIEVYTGPSDVPGEFAGRNAGCGVIVVWTRAGPSRVKH